MEKLTEAQRGVYDTVWRRFWGILSEFPRLEKLTESEMAEWDRMDGVLSSDGGKTTREATAVVSPNQAEEAP